MGIILASQSPRRRELLSVTGLDFTIEVSDANEDLDIKDPVEFVMALSGIKARAVAKKHRLDHVIGADTIVVIDGMILGKPKDEEDAFRMLSLLSGRTHSVYTGVTVIKGEESISFYEQTDVRMYKNSDELLHSYIATGEPMDKAGAYGIQGKGMLLIERIEGDYYNVMGLPIARLYRELSNMMRS